MFAAKFDTPINIYFPDIQVNQYGEQVTTYKLLTTTKAELTKSRGNVVNVGEQLQYIYPIKFRVRNFIAVPDYSVIELKGKYYFVDSVLGFRYYNEIEAHQIDKSLLHFEN